MGYPTRLPAADMHDCLQLECIKWRIPAQCPKALKYGISNNTYILVNWHTNCITNRNHVDHTLSVYTFIDWRCYRPLNCQKDRHPTFPNCQKWLRTSKVHCFRDEILREGGREGRREERGWEGRREGGREGGRREGGREGEREEGRERMERRREK